MTKKAKKQKVKNIDIRERIVDETGDDKLLFMDGYDDCIIGTMERFGMEPIVCYDYDKFIQKLVSEGRKG